jgi:hypothetical protein
MQTQPKQGSIGITNREPTLVSADDLAGIGARHDAVTRQYVTYFEPDAS